MMILFMSKEKIESQIPVLRRPISGIKKEDALSKKLRQFDNPAIKFPFPNASGIYINTNESGVVNTSKALTFFLLLPSQYTSVFLGGTILTLWQSAFHLVLLFVMLIQKIRFSFLLH